MTATEVWNRTYAHELGNLLAGRLVGSISSATSAYGDHTPHGEYEGILNAAGNYYDNDPGARLETCMFGDVAP